jgi:hypothetical protein
MRDGVMDELEAPFVFLDMRGAESGVLLDEPQQLGA